MTCPHETTEPVEAMATLDAVPEVVARLCVDCLERLPASWGCEDCDWFETRTYATPWQLMLGKPCSKHWRNVA